MSLSRPQRMNWYNFFLHLAVVSLAVVVLLLSEQNRRWKMGGYGRDLPGIVVGDTVSMESLTPLDARWARVQNAPRKVLCLIGPTCPHCEAMIPKWNQLARSVRSSVVVLGVVLDSLDAGREYVKQKAIEFPVSVPNDVVEFRKANGILEVPQTLLLGPDGKIESIWKGRLTEEELAEVINAVRHSRQ